MLFFLIFALLASVILPVQAWLGRPRERWEWHSSSAASY
jgi:hypothetical protein